MATVPTPAVSWCNIYNIYIYIYIIIYIYIYIYMIILFFFRQENLYLVEMEQKNVWFYQKRFVLGVNIIIIIII